MRYRRPSLYRRYRPTLRRLSNIAGQGLKAGALTYGGIRLASPAFRGIGRVLERRAPEIASSVRRVASRDTAIEWALPTAVLTSLGAAGALFGRHRRRRRRRF